MTSFPLENPDKFATKEDVVAAWKKEQNYVSVVLAAKDQALAAKDQALASAATAEMLFAEARYNLTVRLAEVSLVLANRASIENLCIQYTENYLDAAGKKKAAITDVYDNHVLNLIAPLKDDKRELTDKAKDWLEKLVTVAKAKADGKDVVSRLSRLWSSLSIDIHTFQGKGYHGLCVGGTFPTNAAVALLVLKAQEDGKCSDVLYFTDGGDFNVTAKLEGGKVTQGKMVEGGTFEAAPVEAMDPQPPKKAP